MKAELLEKVSPSALKDVLDARLSEEVEGLYGFQIPDADGNGRNLMALVVSEGVLTLYRFRRDRHDLESVWRTERWNMSLRDVKSWHLSTLEGTDNPQDLIEAKLTISLTSALGDLGNEITLPIEGAIQYGEHPGGQAPAIVGLARALGAK